MAGGGSMKAEVREALGKAAFEQWNAGLPPWDKLSERTKHSFCNVAEAVAKKFSEILTSDLNTILTEDDVKSLLEQLLHE
jgi:hypothetical protein